MKRAKILMPVMIISLIAFLNGCYPDKIDYVDGFLLERIPGKGIRFRLSEGDSPQNSVLSGQYSVLRRQYSYSVLSAQWTVLSGQYSVLSAK